jgi:two-component system, NtrC family, sensor histidine kinase HydH
MDQTTEENGLSNKLSGRRSKDTIRDITAPLRVIPGGLRRHQKQSQQQAQVRRFTTVLNTTAALFAHEVAGPLQGMSAALQLMESGLQTNQDSMRTFRLEVDRLIILLNEFRSASVPRSLNLKSSDLREVVEEALAIQMIVYRNAGVNVRFQFENGLPALDLDASKIKQVILNLCNNARDAMPKGGDLNIRCYSLGATVILEIADTGTGIQQGLDPFALFKTTKADGTGLGLPIVEQIVLAHNGTIEYTSEPGRGTTFKIILRRQFR